MRRTALVVGAGGFLGRALVSQLHKRGLTIFTIIHRAANQIPEYVQRVSLDWVRAHHESIHCLFYAAGNYRQQSEDLYDSHSRYLKDVLSCVPSAVVVYVSSSAVYGEHEDVIIEASCFNNPGQYGMAKLSAEFIVMQHPSYRIIRLTALYGIGMRSELFIPSIIRSAIEKKSITLFGDGRRLQNYLHIHDAVEIILKASEHKSNGIFLGCSEKEYSNRQVAEIVASYVSGVAIGYTGSDTSPSLRMDNRQTRKILEWEPKIELRDGVRGMI